MIANIVERAPSKITTEQEKIAVLQATIDNLAHFIPEDFANNIEVPQYKDFVHFNANIDKFLTSVISLATGQLEGKIDTTHSREDLISARDQAQAMLNQRYAS